MQSIQTVLNQTYQGYIEIIIIDDSKLSNQDKIKREFSALLKIKKNRKINYIHKGKKEGSPLARNIGIEKAKGEFIAFLDDDDLWLPEKIEKQIKIFENNDNVALVICYSLDKRFGHERINKPPKIVSHGIVLKSFNLSSSSSYLVRKMTIDNVGGFDITLPSAQEYDLAIRLSKEHQIICVPELLMIQNSTKGQISENWNRKIKGLIAIYNKHGSDFSSTSFLNNFKFIGMLGLFALGFLVGNKIYNLIIPMKEQYEVQ
jgi:glycosyltransferase involved in cell wall biosynthesis